jgi:hypothetical protein
VSAVIVVTCATATLLASTVSIHAQQLNGHDIVADDAGVIMSWLTPQASAYDRLLTLQGTFLLGGVPQDPTSDWPAYFTQSSLYPGDPPTVSGWQNNPAGMHAMLAESLLAYYAYSGDSRYIDLVTALLDSDLVHGLTPVGWEWDSVPYAASTAGVIDYDGAEGGYAHVVEPDKIGQLGYAYLEMYEATGRTPYLYAAIHDGDVLAAHVRAGDQGSSPWPFRVLAEDGTILEDYTADVIEPIRLLDELIRLNVGNVATYQSARQVAWNWLMAVPIQNAVWSNYFEDIPIQPDLDNCNQFIPLETARYLLQHPELDIDWLAHVQSILQWVEDQFGVPQFGAMTIEEQVQFPVPLGSDTARFASINAMVFERTADPAAEELAYRALNWATYMASADGQVIDGPDDGQIWFTDSYGDLMGHIIASMGAVPEWAPPGDNHLLRSSSVVTAIAYSDTEVTYTTFDSTSTDVLHLNFTPTYISIDGQRLAQRSVIDGPGWTFDGNSGTLRMYHVGGHHMDITGCQVQPLMNAEPTATVFTTCPAGQWEIANIPRPIGISQDRTK